MLKTNRLKTLELQNPIYANVNLIIINNYQREFNKFCLTAAVFDRIMKITCRYFG